MLRNVEITHPLTSRPVSAAQHSCPSWPYRPPPQSTMGNALACGVDSKSVCCPGFETTTAGGEVKPSRDAEANHKAIDWPPAWRRKGYQAVEQLAIGSGAPPEAIEMVDRRVPVPCEHDSVEEMPLRGSAGNGHRHWSGESFASSKSLHTYLHNERSATRLSNVLAQVQAEWSQILDPSLVDSVPKFVPMCVTFSFPHVHFMAEFFRN